MRAIFAALIISLSWCGIAGAISHQIPRFDADTADVCFPASEWGPAPDSQRPCARVRLWEDGSYRVYVRHADGTRLPPH